ncbi:MAG TPA: choice-of-anchor D domain-containing protein [Solirubrobacterales bacterium]|jgi:hypothetical protein|nr:choice-of-anchor D domain-containing protein [Solirubrobacterales bacterium]
MPKIVALRRAIATTVLALSLALATTAFPASSLAAPEGGSPPPPSPPQLAFAPGNHDFGVQWVNSRAETTFQLSNTGETAVQVNTLEIIGPDSYAFWIGNSDCYGRWLNPGETCSLQVDFGPRDTIAYAAQVRVSANSEYFTADLSGVGGRAIVESSPNPADFGSATVGGTGATRTITLTNSGDLPAGFFIGVISGGDAGSFRLLDENCSGTPLQPSASCTAHVRFAPLSAGSKTAKLSFFGEGEGPTQITLTGEGVAPDVTLAPSSYDFGPQASGTKSAGHPFAVRNDGSAPLDVGGVAIVGADLDQFALSGDTCTGVTLGAGEECLVRVRFAPDSAGAKAATLRVGSDAGPLAASLADLGTAGQAQAVDPQVAPRWRDQHHRFGHGAALTARRAHCHAVKTCRRTVSFKVIAAGG